MSNSPTDTLQRPESNSGPPRTRRPIRRNRESLACSSCRIKKLKCDKQQPCSSCVRRNDPSSCVYRRSREPEARIPEHRDGAEEKLERLESLVKQLVRSRNTFYDGRRPPQWQITRMPSASLQAGVGDPPASSGSDDEEDNGSVYVGATHWSAMLDDIKELKQILRYREDEADSEERIFESLSMDYDNLFGALPSHSLQNILAQYLPPKDECDQCVAIYFRAKALAGPFIHEPQFMRQYQNFWENVEEVSPLWVSMLFCILHMSTKMESSSESQTFQIRDVYARRQRYLVAAAQCLRAGKYYQPKPFSVQALVLYIQCKVTQQLDPSRETGIILGTLIQLAHILGFHRDPDHLRNVTPFEKEMRRRTWAICMQMDLLVSFQLGIPSNTQPGTWDTKLPMNLLDEDFDETTEVMPAPRPDDEPSKVQFFIAKQKLMIAFERILRHSLSSNSNDEDELLLLDCEIRETYQSLPSYLRGEPIDMFPLTDSYRLAVIHCTSFIYQKALCVLHRKHVASGREESIKVCFESGSVMVKGFIAMYAEFKPGGDLYKNRWLFSSFMWNDFLTAIMVLCLIYISTRQKGGSLTVASAKRLEEILEYLKSSWRICTENSDISRGSRRICKVLHSLFASDTRVTPDYSIEYCEAGGVGRSDLNIIEPGMLATAFETPRQSQNLLSGISIEEEEEEQQQQQQENLMDFSQDPFASTDWSGAFMNPIGPDEWNQIQQMLDLPSEFSDWSQQFPQ